MPIMYDLFLPKWYCHIGKKYKKNKKKKTPSPFLLKPLKFLVLDAIGRRNQVAVQQRRFDVMPELPAERSIEEELNDITLQKQQARYSVGSAEW